MSKAKNAIFTRNLSWHHLVLADCGGGCHARLVAAMERLRLPMVNQPHVADLIFVSGVVTGSIVQNLKDVFKGIPKPFFTVRVGTCMGPLNKEFEDPAKNYAVHDKLAKFLPFDLVIEGCPPSSDEIFDKVETLVTYMDVTPEISVSLDKKLDKGVFSP